MPKAFKHRSADENVTDRFLIDGTAEHKKIVQAVIDGDGEQAKVLVQGHIRNLRADMVRRYSLGV